jgi:ABC-type sugar transport system permease subunit
MDKKGKINATNLIMFISGIIILGFNMLLRLKKLPNGMYDVESYMASILSLNFWLVTGFAMLLCIIAIILREID